MKLWIWQASRKWRFWQPSSHCNSSLPVGFEACAPRVRDPWANPRPGGFWEILRGKMKWSFPSLWPCLSEDASEVKPPWVTVTFKYSLAWFIVMFITWKSQRMNYFLLVRAQLQEDVCHNHRGEVTDCCIRAHKWDHRHVGMHTSPMLGEEGAQSLLITYHVAGMIADSSDMWNKIWLYSFYLRCLVHSKCNCCLSHGNVKTT